MMRKRTIAGVGLAGFLVGCTTLGPAPAQEPLARGPARMRVEMFGGFEKSPPAVATGGVALVVDATRSMASTSGFGPSRVRAARAAAERFAENLSADATLELHVLGNSSRAKCDTEPERYEGERGGLVQRIGRLRARGRGSLADALGRFSNEDGDGVGRVVVVSSLADDCAGDLCRAARRLASRGVRLDLVLIGDAEAPACLAGLTSPESAAAPVPWRTNPRAGYRVESTGNDPAVLVCGETGGLPVQMEPGRKSIVVNLDPPLRIERNFTPGTRWVLQVLDFPNLDPPERQWRWLAETAPPAAGGSLAAESAVTP